MRQTLEREIIESINLDIKEDSDLRRVIEAIDELFERMYDKKDGVEEIFIEGVKFRGMLPMAYTTLPEEEDIHIQTVFDLVNLTIIKSFQGLNSLSYEEKIVFNDVNEVIEQLECYDFDCLVSYNVEPEWLIEYLLE